MHGESHDLAIPEMSTKPTAKGFKHLLPIMNKYKQQLQEKTEGQLLEHSFFISKSERHENNLEVSSTSSHLDKS